MLYEYALLSVLIACGYWGWFFIRRSPSGTPTFGLMQLANLSLWIRSRCIKVAQRNPLQAMRDSVPVEHSFNEKLRFAVWIDRFFRFALRDR